MFENINGFKRPLNMILIVLEAVIQSMLVLTFVSNGWEPQMTENSCTAKDLRTFCLSEILEKTVI